MTTPILYTDTIPPGTAGTPVNTSNPLPLAITAPVQLAAGANVVGAAQDAGTAYTISHGVASVPFNSADQHSTTAPITSEPTTGQKLVVTDLVISVDTSMTVTITEETTNNVVWGPHYFPANSGPCQFTPRGKLKHSTANARFLVQTSVAGHITCDAYYYSEP